MAATMPSEGKRGAVATDQSSHLKLASFVVGIVGSLLAYSVLQVRL